MSAEDLTTQPGVALQQDLALATLIGCTHLERNGHHFGVGMADVDVKEQAGFLAAHPDLYYYRGEALHLRINAGRIALGSLDAPGLGGAADPVWDAMDEVDYPH